MLKNNELINEETANKDNNQSEINKIENSKTEDGKAGAGKAEDSKAEDSKAKYIFLFIGDGMGSAHVAAAESYLSGRCIPGAYGDRRRRRRCWQFIKKKLKVF